MANDEIDRILKERKTLEKNVGSLKKQLKEYQDKLKKANKQEKQSLDAVRNFTTQITLLQELVEQNNEQLRVQDREIKVLREQLKDNNRHHERIVEDFQRIAVAVYKNGARQEVELLFASRSLNQAIMRSQYIGFFSRSVMKAVQDLQSIAAQLEENRKSLERSYRKKAGVLKEQKVQMTSVAKKKKQKEVVLDNLKKDKKKFAAGIQANQKKMQKLQAKIEELIQAEQVAVEKERERLRQEAERRRLAGESPPVDIAGAELASLSIDFDKAMGSLAWPVQNGVIIRKFGNNRDPDLNIVTTSNGVDISAGVGTPVKAVSGGIVSQVTYMPTYGNIVLIRHAKSYLTVYANLAKISVAKNDLVALGEVIGSTGPMPQGGSLVHFELWKGKVKLNPEQWLKK